MNPPTGLKLLAIDDSPENLALIAASLESENLEILTENDPEVGFETFLRARPRIVLLDMVMPKARVTSLTSHEGERYPCTAAPVLARASKARSSSPRS